MKWVVELHDDYAEEFKCHPDNVQDEIYAKVDLLEMLGAQLARPYTDTLYGSKHKNMKELRFQVVDGVWRIAFAFDPKRKAILLVGANKKGKSQKQFYKKLIKIADQRFDNHLEKLKE